MDSDHIRNEIVATLSELDLLLLALEETPADSRLMTQICQCWGALGGMGVHSRNCTLEALGREAARVFDLLRCTGRPANPEILTLARTTFERVQLLL